MGQIHLSKLSNFSVNSAQSPRLNVNHNTRLLGLYLLLIRPLLQFIEVTPFCYHGKWDSFSSTMHETTWNIKRSYFFLGKQWSTNDHLRTNQLFVYCRAYARAHTHKHAHKHTHTHKLKKSGIPVVNCLYGDRNRCRENSLTQLEIRSKRPPYTDDLRA